MGVDQVPPGKADAPLSPTPTKDGATRTLAVSDWDGGDSPMPITIDNHAVLCAARSQTPLREGLWGVGEDRASFQQQQVPLRADRAAVEIGEAQYLAREGIQLHEAR